MSTFGVGLVAFNMTQSDIQALSSSLKGSSPQYQVVVDNSPDSKAKGIFESLGWTYIHHPENPGFGASHNKIFDIYAKNADYHLIVNPDIVFSGNVVEELVEFLNQNEDAGCVMPKVFYPDGRIQRLAKLLPSPSDWILRRLPLAKLKKRVNERLELHQANYESGIFKVPFACGCFLLFRSSVIREVGFFDVRFFMYTEDTDPSKRLCVNGTWPYYYGLASVNHGYEKGSSKNLNLLKIHVLSAIRYFNKWGWVDSERSKINRECLQQF